MEFQTTAKSKKSDRSNRTASAAVKSTPQTPSHELLQMQQTIGNRAVSRLIQTKLKVGKPGDVYEREADQVADRVVQTPTPQGKSGLINTPAIQPLSIQRMGSEEDSVSRMAMEEEKPIQKQAKDEESPVQMKEEEPKVAQLQMMEEKDKPLQMKVEDEPVQTKTNNSSTTATPKLESQLSSRQGGGTPLALDVKNFMEPRFGKSFSDVRVHTDGEAVQMNQGLNAQAFTHKQNIYFNQGQYNPDSRSGKQLLAHELTHVVQQTGASGTIQAKEMPGGSTPAAPPPTTEKANSTPKTTETTEALAQSPPPAAKQQSKSKSKAKSPEKSAPTPAPINESASSPVATAPSGSGSDGLLMPEPPTSISSEDRRRIDRVQDNATTATSQQTQLPDAETNVSEARGAVAEPETETQARANEKLVKTLGAKAPPSPELEQLCEKIKAAIESKRPDEDSLATSNPRKVAEEEGTKLNTAVQGDTQKVQNNYNQLQTPVQGTPQQQPQSVQTPPAQIDTPAPGAQAAVPNPVPAENISLDADVAAGEAQMEKAGMNSEAAKLVTTGPIADTRAAQGELVETAKRDPAEVMAEQQAALGKANGDMLALQQAAMESLASARAKTVGGVTNQQQGMTETEEQMRDRISKQAQDIFNNAQKQVDDLLKPLPQKAIEQWNAGINIASEKFEQRLDEVKKWISERQDGGLGIVKWWDDKTGLPGWIIRRYDSAEKGFGADVCKLIKDISSDVNTVIKTCEDIIDTASQEIGKLFTTDLPDSLKTWAAENQAKFTDKLVGLNQRANQTRNDFNKDLANRASTAVQEVREKINALREKAKGTLGRFVDALKQFIDDPIKAIINGLLNLLNIPPDSFWALVAKIQQVIGDIAADPLKFASNLLAAIKLGFQKFFNRIGEHLLQGFLDWLLSGLGSVGVEIPKDFSLKSIVTFFLQLMGITWARIRKLLVKHIGAKNVALIEKAFAVVANLIELGPEGIFELLKDKLDPSNIMKQVIDAAISFLTEALIKQVSARIILLFNPVGAIAQAVEAIYRVLKWIFENAARLFSLVETVVNGIGNVIAGNISGMADAVEMALAQVIVPVIDFLADYAGLGDLPEKIADVIKGFQGWIEGILDTVIGWLAEQGKKLLGALTGDNKKPDERTDEQKKADLDIAMEEANQLINDKNLSKKDIEKKLPKIKSQYNMTSLSLVIDNSTETKETYHIHGVINPEADTPNVDKEKSKWPVEKENNVKRVDGNVVEEILSIEPDKITISLSTRSKKATAVGKQTLNFDVFIELWNSGKFILSSKKSEAQKRAELEAKFPGKTRIVDAIMNRGELREKIDALSGEQAHHIIPIEILEKDYETIQKLVHLGGWDFNGEINGVPLSEGFHGNHPKYTAYVFEQIEMWQNKNKRATIDDMKIYVEKLLIPHLLTEIEKAKIKSAQEKANNPKVSYTLNDYFKDKI
jgi:Domain of unknown function (DUF4157)/A nuclease family of the HNH/ENDO VII superfamily with conserved AHH